MKILIILLILITPLLVSFLKPNPYQSYCDKWALTAQMYQVTHGIPASIQLAQAIVESGGGRSSIGRNANNHFGIRCGDNWKGERHYTKSGCWRCYDSVNASYLDHVNFLAKYYSSGCGKSYKYWRGFEGYGGAGYWKHIFNTIEKYKLYEYDN